MPRGSRGRRTLAWSAPSMLLLTLAGGCHGLPTPRPESVPAPPGVPVAAAAAASAFDSPGPAPEALASMPTLRPVTDVEALPPTPMLDAAFQRAEAMKRDAADKDLADAPEPPPVPPIAEPPPSLPETSSAASHAIPVAVARPLDVEFSPAESWDAALERLRHLAHERSGGKGDDDWTLREKVLGGLSEGGGNVRKAVRAAVGDGGGVAEPSPPAEEDEGPFRVNELKACRRVIGFGNVEPWDGSSIRPGRPLILYCDLGGLRHEPEGDGFRSRLESTIELVPESGGEPVWTQALGTAEDVCARRRRDFFVSYQIALPKTLPAGEYRLRLTLKDVFAGRTASESIPLTVRP